MCDSQWSISGSNVHVHAFITPTIPGANPDQHLAAVFSARHLAEVTCQSSSVQCTVMSL